MTRIRRLNCSDAPKIKKIISYLDDSVTKALAGEAFTRLQAFLPLKYKFAPESFVLVDKENILGLITAVPAAGNHYKINIIRLAFRQNHYEAGKQLVEFVIAKYGARGAVSFTVSIDVSHSELADLFISGCGFRQCSSESLWKIDNAAHSKENLLPYRTSQKSDAKNISILYNNELISHFRPSLDRKKQEFQEPLFTGLTNFYKNGYVLENNNSLISCLSVTTTDNKNFVIDINNSCEISYDEIISFAVNEIMRRNKNFQAFVKLKNYTAGAAHLEKYLQDKSFKCVRTQLILVKDFYKPVKQPENSLQVFLFGESALEAQG
ncbi:MAG: hypothetical protein LBK53_08560 [Heliobacteriaceae bacterium]|jgi:hypothetical protein|nr:hypothetical protein [Heliobacteriaceae bacterium]